MPRLAKDKWVFNFYTFQLVPVSTQPRLIFEYSITTVEELREVKNRILADILNSQNFRFSYKGERLNHKVLYSDTEYIIIRLANYKPLKAEKSFHEIIYENEPSVLIMFDNNPTKQTLAIQHDKKVFSSTDAIAELIRKSLMQRLLDFNLQPYIENRYLESDFWELAERYQNRIRELKVELVKENLSDIYRSLSEDLKEFANDLNSHKTTIVTQAPEGSVLENINPGNNQLSDMVQASSKGTGPITLKIVGLSKSISTKTQTSSKEVQAIDLDNLDGPTLLQALKIIFPDNNE